MASAKQKVSDARPYVQRALRDDEVRDNLKSAFFAARDVYDELLGGRGPTAVATRVATDKEIQENLRKVADELRGAVDRIQGKDDHTGRNVFLLLTGVAIGILFNPFSGPQTRKWVKDKIFGAEPEFSYQGNSPSGT
jgi:gas vesicle protein